MIVAELLHGDRLSPSRKTGRIHLNSGQASREQETLHLPVKMIVAEVLRLRHLAFSLHQRESRKCSSLSKDRMEHEEKV